MPQSDNGISQDREVPQLVQAAMMAALGAKRVKG